MELHIHNHEAAQLALQLSRNMGRSVDEVVLEALRKEAKQENIVDQKLYDDLMALAERFADLPVYDDRSAEEILGYDENGLPH